MCGSQSVFPQQHHHHREFIKNTNSWIPPQTYCTGSPESSSNPFQWIIQVILAHTEVWETLEFVLKTNKKILVYVGIVKKEQRSQKPQLQLNSILFAFVSSKWFLVRFSCFHDEGIHSFFCFEVTIDRKLFIASYMAKNKNKTKENLTFIICMPTEGTGPTLRKKFLNSPLNLFPRPIFNHNALKVYRPSSGEYRLQRAEFKEYSFQSFFFIQRKYFMHCCII